MTWKLSALEPKGQEIVEEQQKGWRKEDSRHGRAREQH